MKRLPICLATSLPVLTCPGMRTYQSYLPSSALVARVSIIVLREPDMRLGVEFGDYQLCG